MPGRCAPASQRLRAPAHSVIRHRSAQPGVEAFTLATGHAFPRHAHDQFGVGVLCSGAQRSWSGIGSVEATAGDVITVNPGEIHDGRPYGCCARSWRMLYLDPALVAGEAAAWQAPPVEIARPALRDDALRAAFMTAFAELTRAVPDRLAAEESQLRLLALLLHRHGTRPERRSEPAPAVRTALRRIEEAPELRWTLAELAQACGVSRFALLRGFRRDVGTTPHAYLIQRRVRLARQLLAAGTSPADAAAAAGFADQSHLTRAFVRQLGITPGRYRTALA